eukprot:122068-Pelagomonas_calceolata.AAC.1
MDSQAREGTRKAGEQLGNEGGAWTFFGAFACRSGTHTLWTHTNLLRCVQQQQDINTPTHTRELWRVRVLTSHMPVGYNKTAKLHSRPLSITQKTQHSHGLALHAPGAPWSTASHGWASDHPLPAEPAESCSAFHRSGPASHTASHGPWRTQANAPLLARSQPLAAALQPKLHTAETCVCVQNQALLRADNYCQSSILLQPARPFLFVPGQTGINLMQRRGPSWSFFLSQCF